TQIGTATAPFWMVVSDMGIDVALLGKTLSDFSSGQWWNLPGDVQGLLNALGAYGSYGGGSDTAGLGSHALGTITTRDQLAFLHRNEAVIPLDHPARAAQLIRQAGLAGGGGAGLIQNITFTGPVADEYVASKVNARLA